MRILYLLSYVKSPKTTVKYSKISRSKHRSSRFGCVLCEVQEYKLINIKTVIVSYHSST